MQLRDGSCFTLFLPVLQGKRFDIFFVGSITEQGKYYPDAKQKHEAERSADFTWERSVIMDSSDSHGRLWNGGTWMIWNAVVTHRKEL